MTTKNIIAEGKLPFVGAAVLFFLSCLWVVVGPEDTRRLARQTGALALTGPVYQAEEWPQPAATIRAWSSPVAPASVPGWWHGEVFTPPAIPAPGTSMGFSNVASAENGTGPLWREVELLAVKREPYRLQLMGYVGAPGDYRAVFARPGRPGTLLVREGEAIADLDLCLLRLRVNDVAGPRSQGRTTRATLHDARSGESVVLDSRTVHPSGALLAVLKSAGEPRPREWHEGDEWTTGAITYRLERIVLDPPEVVVVRQRPDGSYGEREVLRPAPGGISPGRKIAGSMISSSATTSQAAERN